MRDKELGGSPWRLDGLQDAGDLDEISVRGIIGATAEAK
jgi:hypothetical protein